MKKLFAFFVFAFCITFAIAQNPYDTMVDGICYKIVGDEAMVTVHDNNQGWNAEYYSGKIVIPESIKYGNKSYPVTKIGPKTFKYCLELTEVYLPDNLTTISTEAFSSIASLLKLRIGANVKEIGKNALSNLALEELDLDPANKYFVLEKGVLYSADHKHAYTFVGDRLNYDENMVSQSHDLWLHDDLEYVEDGFNNGRRLNTIRFGNALKSIGDEAFRYAFAETLNQSDLILPDGIEHIGWGAFADCIRINNLHLPDSLTRLEPLSFSFVSPEYIHMPKNLKVICDNALSCDGGGLYRNLVLPEGLDSIGEFGITCISCDSLIVPSTVRHLSYYSLDNFSRYIEIKAPLEVIDSCAMPSQCVRELILPKTVKRIEAAAFYPCYDLKKIVWPEALEYVGNWALAGNKLNPMVVPSTVKTLGSCAFSDNVYEPRTYYFTSPTPPACLREDVFDYNDLDESTLYVPKGCREVYASTIPYSWFGTIEEYSEIVIPPTSTRYDFELDGLYYKVLSEDEKTCELSYDLNFITDKVTYSYKNVTIPSSVVYNGKTYTVTSVESAAFYETPLERVNLPQSLVNLEGAFTNCYNLTSVEIPENVTNIGAAFGDCKELRSIHLPDKIENICSAFHGCSKLESVNIPSSVHYIDGAFHGCSSLTSLDLPDDIEDTGECTFFGCSNLKHVHLPANLTRIGENAFSGCEKLNNIVLPSKLEFIFTGAFQDCYALTDIISLNSEAPYGIGYSHFSTDDITIHVPYGSKSSYQVVNPWQYFNIVEDVDVTAIRHPGLAPSFMKTYDILGRPVNDNYKGLIIRDGKLMLRK